MANKQIKALRNLTQTELDQKVVGLENTLFQTRFKKSTGQLADTSQINKIRKEIARAKTIQTEAKGK